MFGAGSIGAAIIAILVARGISVAAVELTDVRLELAAALGATVFRPDELTIPDHPGETPERVTMSCMNRRPQGRPAR